VRALTHALDGGRLHHAYLFTGTRGVGKTTLSRILAKALNCEKGVSSTPCGVCRACREIDEGRFVDYLEMDAASNRGVDEMAALLERAVYAPVDARFKVYMIDEVHMLTNHAFNAMLKTLEEPPPHVKFILATTDPQKIPVTVLSRCLQFNLKQMPAGAIVTHLEHILGEENIAYEPQALRLLARAADGSMRDALSLTDQAIAYAASQITEEAVRGMLGALDQSYLIRLIDAVIAQDGAAVLAIADEMALRSLSFPIALQDLAGLFHRVAWAQFAPSSVLDEWPEAADLRRFASAMSAEQVQLCYQIATVGRAELGLAPDEYAGFTMTLLRMLAFEPSTRSTSTSTSTSTSAPAPAPASVAAAAPAQAPAPSPATPKRGGASEALDVLKNIKNTRATGAKGRTKSVASAPDRHAAPAGAPSALRLDAVGFSGDWPTLAASLPLTGVTHQLAFNSELGALEGATLKLVVAVSQYAEASHVTKLKAALAEKLGQPVDVQVEVGAARDTATARDTAANAHRQRDAEQEISNAPLVQQLIREFGASIVPGSVKPLESRVPDSHPLKTQKEL